MPKVNFTKKARTDIYARGVPVKKKNKKGEEVTVYDKTKKGENDTLRVKAGESYYWWKFAFGPKIISTTAPSRSQLTQSSFLQQLYELEDTIESASAGSIQDLENLRDEWVGEIESMRDECQDKKDNMPEQLQEVGSGAILGERIDALDSWLSDLEGWSSNIDEEQLKADAESDWEALTEEEQEANDHEAWVNDKFSETLQEAIDGELDELKSFNSGL